MHIKTHKTRSALLQCLCIIRCNAHPTAPLQRPTDLHHMNFGNLELVDLLGNLLPNDVPFQSLGLLK